MVYIHMADYSEQEGISARGWVHTDTTGHCPPLSTCQVSSIPSDLALAPLGSPFHSSIHPGETFLAGGPSSVLGQQCVAVSAQAANTPEVEWQVPCFASL